MSVTVRGHEDHRQSPGRADAYRPVRGKVQHRGPRKEWPVSSEESQETGGEGRDGPLTWSCPAGAARAQPVGGGGFERDWGARRQASRQRPGF